MQHYFVVLLIFGRLQVEEIEFVVGIGVDCGARGVCTDENLT